VSVVCIAYNHERFIRDAIMGVVGQQVDFEVEMILADDCSTDSTPAIAAELALRFPGMIRVIARPENVGTYENLMQSIGVADGEFIALCEGDDYWTDPSKLAKQVALMEARDDLSLCFHRVRVVTLDGETADSVWPTREFSKPPELNDLLRENFIPTLSVMYRNEDMSRDRFPDVSPLDWYLHLARAKVGGIGFLDEVMGVYRRHPQGLWWAHDHDPPAFWRYHASGHLAFCDAIAELFAGEPGRLALVGSVASDAFRGIAAHLADEGDDYWRELIRNHPTSAGLALRDFVTSLGDSTAYARQLEAAIAQLEDAHEREREVSSMTTAKLEKRLERAERRADRLTSQRSELARALAELQRQPNRRKARVLVRRLRRLLARLRW
jgi:hypothetical protein